MPVLVKRWYLVFSKRTLLSERAWSHCVILSHDFPRGEFCPLRALAFWQDKQDFWHKCDETGQRKHWVPSSVATWSWGRNLPEILSSLRPSHPGVAISRALDHSASIKLGLIILPLGCWGGKKWLASNAPCRVPGYSPSLLLVICPFSFWCKLKV